MEDAAKSAWLFPLVGAAIAIPSGAIYIIMREQLFYPPHLATAVALFVLLLLTGFHHLDGLLDVGDGLMLRAAKEDRLRAMRDASTGAGGFGLGFFVLLITYTAYLWVHKPLYDIVAAEALAKFSMVLGLYAGTSSHEGVGSAFLRVTKGNKHMLALAFLLTSAIVYVLLGPGGASKVAITIVFTLLMLWYFNREFGGIGGDALGALNELTRMIILVTLT